MVVQGVSPIGKIISDTGTVVPSIRPISPLAPGIDLNGFVDVFVYDLSDSVRVSLTKEAQKAMEIPTTEFISGTERRLPSTHTPTILFRGTTISNRMSSCVTGRLLARLRYEPVHSRSNWQRDSQNPCISSDGRYVAFESNSTNLAMEQTTANIRYSSTTGRVWFKYI